MYLKKCLDKHKKSKKLKITKYMQPYLQSEHLNLEEKRILFKLRCYSLMDIKYNQKSSFLSNLKCRLCKEEDSVETQLHLTSCKFVIQTLGSETDHFREDDMFGDLGKQIEAIKVWKKIIQLLKNNNQEL